MIFDYRGSRDNQLLFGAGIEFEDLLVSRPAGSASSLRITFKSMPGAIVVEGQSWSDAGVELFRFADGTAITEAQMLALLIPATDGNDTLQGGASGEAMWGLEGADILSGYGGADTIYGQDGNDRLEGGEEDDVLQGGAGEDVLIGDDPFVYGPNLIVNGSFEQSGTIVSSGSWGKANSTLPGWTKANAQNFEQVASGYSGVSASQGGYWLDLDSAGGTGSNMEISQIVSGLAAGQALLLQFDHANRTTAASGGFEIWWNGTLVATISSSGKVMQTKSYELIAAGGSDVLTFKGIGSADNAGASLDNVRLVTVTPGTAGDDVLDGGDGNDLLDGGGGADLLTGGAGSDLFRYESGDTGIGAAADRIADFLPGLDRIDLAAVDASSGSAGDQAFVFIGASAFSNTAGELRVHSDANDVRLQADTDGDGFADFEIVLLGGPIPAAADFLL